MTHFILAHKRSGRYFWSRLPRLQTMTDHFIWHVVRCASVELALRRRFHIHFKMTFTHFEALPCGMILKIPPCFFPSGGGTEASEQLRGDKGGKRCTESSDSLHLACRLVLINGPRHTPSFGLHAEVDENNKKPSM